MGIRTKSARKTVPLPRLVWPTHLQIYTYLYWGRELSSVNSIWLRGETISYYSTTVFHAKSSNFQSESQTLPHKQPCGWVRGCTVAVTPGGFLHKHPGIERQIKIPTHTVVAQGDSSLGRVRDDQSHLCEQIYGTNSLCTSSTPRLPFRDLLHVSQLFFSENARGQGFRDTL